VLLITDAPSEACSRASVTDADGAAISAHPANKMIDLLSIGDSLSFRVKSGSGRAWEALFSLI
jgi:hypothetical protein